jgi:hypothetical protein
LRTSKPTNDISRSPNAEEIEVEDTHPIPDDLSSSDNQAPVVQQKKKTHNRTKKRILESSEDENDQAPPTHGLVVQPRKKVRVDAQVKKHHSFTEAVVDNDSEVRPRKSQQKTSKKTKSQSKKSTGSNSRKKDTATDSDSEPEIIEKPKESAEKELGT